MDWDFIGPLPSRTPKPLTGRSTPLMIPSLSGKIRGSLRSSSCIHGSNLGVEQAWKQVCNQFWVVIYHLYWSLWVSRVLVSTSCSLYSDNSPNFSPINVTVMLRIELNPLFSQVITLENTLLTRYTIILRSSRATQLMVVHHEDYPMQPKVYSLWVWPFR